MNEELLVWLKQKEIEALGRKPENANDDLRRWAYFDGKKRQQSTWLS